MKKFFSISALALFGLLTSSGAFAACPDLSGKFRVQGRDETGTPTDMVLEIRRGNSAEEYVFLGDRGGLEGRIVADGVVRAVYDLQLQRYTCVGVALIQENFIQENGALKLISTGAYQLDAKQNPSSDLVISFTGQQNGQTISFSFVAERMK